MRPPRIRGKRRSEPQGRAGSLDESDRGTGTRESISLSAPLGLPASKPIRRAERSSRPARLWVFTAGLKCPPPPSQLFSPRREGRGARPRRAGRRAGLGARRPARAPRVRVGAWPWRRISPVRWSAFGEARRRGLGRARRSAPAAPEPPGGLPPWKPEGGEPYKAIRTKPAGPAGGQRQGAGRRRPGGGEPSSDIPRCCYPQALGSKAPRGDPVRLPDHYLFPSTPLLTCSFSVTYVTPPSSPGEGGWAGTGEEGRGDEGQRRSQGESDEAPTAPASPRTPDAGRSRGRAPGR